jgi:hypothetical protein
MANIYRGVLNLIDGIKPGLVEESGGLEVVNRDVRAEIA